MSKAINAFYLATAGMGLANQVTTFTLSDFGRTMKPNSAGTDRGWGAHHFVVGGDGSATGSVAGNNFYGFYPDLGARFSLHDGITPVTEPLPPEEGDATQCVHVDDLPIRIGPQSTVAFFEYADTTIEPFAAGGGSPGSSSRGFFVARRSTTGRRQAAGRSVTVAPPFMSVVSWPRWVLNRCTAATARELTGPAVDAALYERLGEPCGRTPLPTARASYP